MKKKAGYIVATVLVVGAVLASTFFTKNQFQLKLNGDEISKEEYLYVMNQQIYDVTNELTADHNVIIDEAFWSSEIDGIVPYEKLADCTVTRLKQIRAAYEHAKEQGYVDALGYEEMLKRMETENQIRAEKIKKGEPVFGLSKFSTELFMEYEMDSFQKQYCENMNHAEMKITEEEQKQYYEENKEVLFQKNDDITLDYIKIPYGMEYMTEAEVQGYEKALTDIYKKMDATHSLQQLVAEQAMLQPYFVHEELLSGEISAKAKVIGDVLELGYSLNPGESTQVVDENGALYLIQCTAKTDYDYLELEEVKDHINKELREQHYDKMIEKKAADMKVDGDWKHVYDFTKKHIIK